MMNHDAIWQSFENVHRAASELDALSRALTDMIEEGAIGSIVTRSWNEDSISDEGDWLLEYYLETTRLYEAKRLLGTLSLGWSLRRNEDHHGSSWVGARAAKLYVGFSPPPGAWSKDDLFVDGNGTSPRAQPGAAGLWTDPADASRWFFAVRLIELCSREDLRREVLDPFGRLLRQETPEAAFRNSTALLKTV